MAYIAATSAGVLGIDAGAADAGIPDVSDAETDGGALELDEGPPGAPAVGAPASPLG